jgi:CDGSH-type Zn-finger protein
MARLAKRTQTAPYRLTVNDVDQWLCKCGLSKTSRSATAHTN